MFLHIILIDNLDVGTNTVSYCYMCHYCEEFSTFRVWSILEKCNGKIGPFSNITALHVILMFEVGSFFQQFPADFLSTSLPACYSAPFIT